jgi:hypothetical protein
VEIQLATLIADSHQLHALLGPIIRESAYLDPGSGSYLLQLLLAALLGSMFVLRSSWSRIKAFFQRKPVEREEDQEDEQ